MDDLLRAIADRLRAGDRDRRAARPLRPGRRAGRRPPRGRGAGRGAGRGRHPGPGPPRREGRSRLAGLPASTAPVRLSTTLTEGFRPPPYPYDRLDELKAVGRRPARRAGRPLDRHARATRRRLRWSRPWPAPAPSGATRRPSAARLPRGRGGLDGPPPRRDGRSRRPRRLRRHQGVRGRHARSGCACARPDRDTVLYPQVSLPQLRHGGHAGRLPGRGRPARSDGALDLGAIDPADAERALCLWVNSPGNPAGGLDDLGAAAAWGRAHGVPVLSDECYVEFTWDGPPRTILEHGARRACWPCTRCRSAPTWPASGPASTPATPSWSPTCAEVRKHAGLMVPGPGAGRRGGGLGRRRPRRRAAGPLPAPAGADGRRSWPAAGIAVPLPAGAFYLWVPAPDGDAWGLTRRLAAEGGALVAPGEFYGGRRPRAHRRGAARRPPRAGGSTTGEGLRP